MIILPDGIFFNSKTPCALVMVAFFDGNTLIETPCKFSFFPCTVPVMETCAKHAEKIIILKKLATIFFIFLFYKSHKAIVEYMHNKLCGVKKFYFIIVPSAATFASFFLPLMVYSTSK